MCLGINLTKYGQVLYKELQNFIDQCLSTDEFIMWYIHIIKMWYIHAMEYYSVLKRVHTTTKMSLENIMLSERNETQKTIFCVTPLT